MLRDGLGVAAEAIGAELDAVGKAGLQVGQELIGAFVGAEANQPARHQFRHRINGREGVTVAQAQRRVGIVRHVLLLAADERPNLVHLKLGDAQVAHYAVLVHGARFAHVGQQPQHRVLAGARRPARSVDAHALRQHVQDAHAVLGGEAVHAGHCYLRTDKTQVNYLHLQLLQGASDERRQRRGEG